MPLQLTVADALHAFHLDRKLSNLSPRTIEWYERRLGDFLMPLRETPLSDITEIVLNELELFAPPAPGPTIAWNRTTHRARVSSLKVPPSAVSKCPSDDNCSTSRSSDAVSRADTFCDSRYPSLFVTRRDVCRNSAHKDTLFWCLLM